MRTSSLGGLTAILAAPVLMLLVGPGSAWARDLTFEERVQAQATIERVYHSHLTGSAKKPFGQVVTQALLEAKVRTYLKESAALDKQWNTPVTEEMLRKETQRIASLSRMPDRLLELYAALGNDSFLVQECLARPILVERMTHSFFAFDHSLHHEERSGAEELQKELAGGRIDPRAQRQGRNELRLALAPAETDRGPEAADLGANPDPDPSRLDLTEADLGRWDARLPGDAGGVGPVLESRDAFVVHVLLDKEEGSRHVANYVVPKSGWDEWWAHAAARFDERSVRAVASPSAALPIPTGSGTTWNPEGMTTTAAGSTQSVVAQAPADDTWNSGSLDALPDPRYRHSAVWTGTEMIVWGGFNNGAYLNSGGRYDPATDSWRPMSTIQAPEGRTLHATVWTGNRMFVWGGYSPRLLYSSSFGCTLSETPKNDGSGTCTESGIPGNALALPMNPLDTGGLYDPASDTWQPTPMESLTPSGTVHAPSPRYGASAVFLPFGDLFPDPNAGYIIIWGGFGVFRRTACGLPYDSLMYQTTQRLKYLDDGGAFLVSSSGGDWDYKYGLLPYDAFPIVQTDPITNQTTTIYRSPNVPTGRWQHLAVVYPVRVTDPNDFNFGLDDPHVVIWGGYGYTAYAQDSCSRRIPSTSSLPAYLSTGAIYDVFNDSWIPISATNAPLGRTFSAGVWTGNRFVVWGGYYGGNAQALNTGGVYNPATDTWSPTSVNPGVTPLPRYDHSAIWTGSRMIVWGGLTKVIDAQGITDVLPFGDGAQYDPATDSWSAISSSNAPMARFGHSALWTGSQMIVWGGNGALTARDFLSALNTGGRYDPASNSWTPTLTTAAPSPRSEHTAIWTGSQMIVWGGADHSNITYPLQGGRYDPATDSWTTTSIVNAPKGNATGQGRAAHAAVWTGSTMLVWGGYAITGYDVALIPSEEYYQTGGQYDPASDSWTALSTTSAPVPRRNHTAIWSGSRMVVWGGDLATIGSDGTKTTSYLNDGGRYDPTTNSWKAISPVFAPSRRTYHSAVWTGSRMLIWGGFLPVGLAELQKESYLNSGASYDPVADNWTPIAQKVCSNDPTQACTTQFDCPTGGSCEAVPGLPDARARHSAVWTGSQMIIWGGVGMGIRSIGGTEPCCFGLFTGGRYEPSTDTWTPTSTAGAPTVSVYDPDTDPPTAYPFGRYGHSALWTGTQMLVWGGLGATRPGQGEFTNTGGRYDPAADQWTSTTIVGAASARAGHAAVWTGEEMLLFGGGTSGSDLQSGGRYAAISGTLATYYLDSDGDGTGSASVSVQAYSQPAGYVANTLDCNDADPGVWATPSEVRNVSFRDRGTVAWDPPSAPGAATVLYDALRSTRPSDFLTSAVCLESDGTALSLVEPAAPPSGSAFFYLVRAQDGCPGTAGTGSLGTDSRGIQRSGRACP